MKNINCLICSKLLSIRLAKGRKSNKPFIMLVCPLDGRHFRGFISDQKYINSLLDEHKELINDQKLKVKG